MELFVSHFHSFHFFFLFFPTFFLIMPPVNSKKQPNEASRKRKSLTAAQKNEICLKKTTTPFIKQKELAIQYDVSEGMISDILKEKDR